MKLSRSLVPSMYPTSTSTALPNLGSVKDKAGKATEWGFKNPAATTGLCFTAVGVSVLFSPVAAVGLVGFGAAGPVAGGLAAGTQIPNVAAGSVFAVMQSAGMSGAGVGAVKLAGAGITTIGGALVSGATLMKASKDAKKGQKRESKL